MAIIMLSLIALAVEPPARHSLLLPRLRNLVLACSAAHLPCPALTRAARAPRDMESLIPYSVLDAVNWVRPPIPARRPAPWLCDVGA
eukprot:2113111-Rhodomonas_salina.2